MFQKPFANTVSFWFFTIQPVKMNQLIIKHRVKTGIYERNY